MFLTLSCKQQRIYVFSALVALLLATIVIAASTGAVSLNARAFLDLFRLSATAAAHDYSSQILLHIRLPRVVAALLVGGSLAICGAVMQGLFRNPLVDPGIVGVMSGASLAASFSIVLGGALMPMLFKRLGDYALPFMAFLGAWAMTLILYRFSRRGGSLNIAAMLLIGIAFGALAGALTGLLTYAADDNQLRSLTFWGMGSLAIFDWHKLAILSCVCAFSIPLLAREVRLLDALMLGEKVAGHLGFHIERAKKRLIFLVALLVGTAVAFSGGIGFIGLVVPHIVRGLVGSNHRYVFPASFIFGATLLCLADVIARTIVSPAELPIGIITSMIGAPFLGYLVWRQMGGLRS
ncbi:Hemin transport system permease protein HmuU [Oligella sp. MSHR50489EDL]|uniref:FecCD family ABC transporter permease n=1 Tax=Oligella sp. MSHR50489EDL TaxID=3139409 RepID=UPI003D816A41